MSEADRTWRWSARALGATTAAASLLIAMGSMAGRTWNSDDVAWQNAFRSWRPGSSTLFLPDNTFILQWPVVVAADLALPAAPRQLFFVSIVLSAAALLAGRWAVRAALHQRVSRPLLLREEAVAAAVVVALMVTGPDMRQIAGHINARNFEVGVYPALLVLGALALTGGISTTGWRRAAVAIAVVALVCLNDPLFAYTAVGPALIVVAARWRNHRAVARDLAVWLAGGLVGWLLGRAALVAAGVDQQSAGIEVTPGAFFTQVGPTLGTVGRGLGFTRRSPTIAQAPQMLAAVGVLVLLVAGVVALLRHRRRGDLTPLICLGWTLLVCGATAATSAGSVQIARYVLVGLVGLAPTVAVGAAALRYGAEIAVAAAVLGATGAVLTHATNYTGEESQSNLTLVRTLDDLGDAPVHVLAGYWTAGVVTFYADGDVTATAVLCSGTTTRFFPWLADTGPFDHARDADLGRTAIVVDPQPPGPCQPPELRAQFGEPDDVIGGFDGHPDRTVWVYERNVFRDVPAWTPDL